MSDVHETGAADGSQDEAVAGRWVSTTFAFDATGDRPGRGVTVYVPPAPVQAIVYAGDGAQLARWGATIEKAALPPVAAATMIVGIHHSDEPDEMARIKEYSPGFDPAVFSAHERFVLDDVRAWVRTRFAVDLPPARTAVLGVSASAELALALGVRHPEIFGVVLAASPGGGYRPPDELAAPLPRAYLLGGTGEPWFAENARRWADALGAAGADVVMVERPGEHGGPFWEAELPTMLRWAFA